MATVNRVNKRTKVKPLTATPLKGWTDEDGPCKLSNLDREYVEVSYHEKGKEFSISFEGADFLYCCGIIELGSLFISEGFPLKQFKELFFNLIDSYKGRTLIINTNGKGSSIIFENLLSKTNLFTPVKRFKNSNSKNIITMWVSNGGAL